MARISEVPVGTPQDTDEFVIRRPGEPDGAANFRYSKLTILSALNADNLTSGTIPQARFPTNLTINGILSSDSLSVGGGNASISNAGVINAVLVLAGVVETSVGIRTPLIQDDNSNDVFNLIGGAAFTTLLEASTQVNSPLFKALTPASGAGNNVTLQASNAVSGNSNGGDVLLLPGDNFGSGAEGFVIVRKPGGTPGTHEIKIYHDGTNARITPGTGPVLLPATGLYVLNAGQAGFFGSGGGFHLVGGSTNCMSVWAGGPVLGNAIHLLWASGSSPNTGTFGSGIKRVVDAVLAITDGGSTNLGWIQDAGGPRVTADVTNATATMATITGLTAPLKAGRTYAFQAVVLCEEDVPGDGVAIDFNGGTATPTDFEALGTIVDVTNGLVATVASTALDTDIKVATITGAGRIEVTGTITVNEAGTFIVRGAQNSHTTGTVTFKRGSYLIVRDMV